MAEEEAKDNEQQPDQKSNSANVTPVDNSVPNYEAPKTPEKPRKKKKAITVKVIQEKTNQPTIANVISAISAAISFGLGVLTLWLYFQAKEATKLTGDALRHQIAKDRADSINTANKDTADAIANRAKYTRDSDFISKQKAGIDSQIVAVQQTQRDFNISNEPYLQVIQVKLDTFIEGKPIHVSCGFENLGGYPVKVDSSKTVISVRMFNPGFDHKIKISDYSTDIINLYVTRGYPQGYTIESDYPLSKSSYLAVIYDKYYVWLTGKIIYHNIINKESKIYTFAMKIKPNMTARFVVNDNVKNN